MQDVDTARIDLTEDRPRDHPTGELLPELSCPSWCAKDEHEWVKIGGQRSRRHEGQLPLPYAGAPVLLVAYDYWFPGGTLHQGRSVEFPAGAAVSLANLKELTAALEDGRLNGGR